EPLDLAARHGLHVVEIDRAGAREPLDPQYRHLRRDAANRRRHRSDRDLAEILEDAVAGEDDDRPALVRPGEPIPTDLAPLHSSPHASPDSHTSTSPRATGRRLEPR